MCDARGYLSKDVLSAPRCTRGPVPALLLGSLLCPAPGLLLCPVPELALLERLLSPALPVFSGREAACRTGGEGRAFPWLLCGFVGSRGEAAWPLLGVSFRTILAPPRRRSMPQRRRRAEHASLARRRGRSAPTLPCTLPSSPPSLLPTLARAASASRFRHARAAPALSLWQALLHPAWDPHASSDSQGSGVSRSAILKRIEDLAMQIAAAPWRGVAGILVSPENLGIFGFCKVIVGDCLSERVASRVHTQRTDFQK